MKFHTLSDLVYGLLDTLYTDSIGTDSVYGIPYTLQSHVWEYSIHSIRTPPSLHIHQTVRNARPDTFFSEDFFPWIIYTGIFFRNFPITGTFRGAGSIGISQRSIRYLVVENFTSIRKKLTCPQ